MQYSIVPNAVCTCLDKVFEAVKQHVFFSLEK